MLAPTEKLYKKQDRQYTWHNIEELSCNHYCSGKTNEWYITWACVFVALGTQQSMRMRHIVICDLSHKRHDFRKRIIEHKTCVSRFSSTLVEENPDIWKGHKVSRFISMDLESSKTRAMFIRNVGKHPASHHIPRHQNRRRGHHITISQ